MKFSRKSKRPSHHSRKNLSNQDLSLKINEVKNSRKKFRFLFLKKLTRRNAQDKSTIKLPLITPLLSPRIEELENEFMNMLTKMYNKSKTQTYQQGKHSTNKPIEQCDQIKFHVNKRLLITRSLDDFARKSGKRYLCSSLSSEPLHQSLLKNITRRASHSDTTLTIIPKRRTQEIPSSSIKLPPESINCTKHLPLNISIKSESCLKKQNSRSIHWDENALKSTLTQYQQQEAAIIEIEHHSYVSTSSSTNFSKPLEKSHSSPLPRNTNHSSISNNYIQSAHVIDQYQYEKKSGISLYSCVSEMGNDDSMESISSDEESVQHSLLRYHENIKKRSLRHRWSLVDIWERTMAKLPPILNCIWRQRLYRTGSREFLLEYDRTLPTNSNNNRANIIQEQRYVEQERPVNSHIGLALLALLIFPPVGILAMILSVWCLCGQQDRHLSRKFGNAVYWISLLAICLSFLLLFTLFTYFTYQYLINRHVITHRSLTNDIDNA